MSAVYLFGSQANGLTTDSSDIDLAFFTAMTEEIPSLKLYKVQKELEIFFRKDVDLVYLNKASIVFQFQVVTTGVPLYVKNASQLLRQEALILSMYQRLNEERKGILDEIASTGKIYS